MSDIVLSRREVLAALDIEDSFLVALESARVVSVDEGDHFSRPVVHRIRICHTLHHDLGVNLEGLEVALHLLDFIADERRQFHQTLQWLAKRLGEGRGD